MCNPYSQVRKLTNITVNLKYNLIELHANSNISVLRNTHDSICLVESPLEYTIPVYSTLTVFPDN